ncbi:MAG: hypothetical protein RLZZ417_369 [Bacteroidota bacterium]|jgi:hypothetical protein
MPRSYLKGCLKTSLLIGLSFYALPLFTQGLPLPLDNPGLDWVERFQIKTGINLPSHSALKNYQRKTVWDFARKLDSLPGLTTVDKANIVWLKNDNNDWADSTYLPVEKGIFSWFYPKKYHAFEVNTPELSLRLNPVLYLQAGPMGERPYFINQRGVDFRANMSNFYIAFTVLETQALFPSFIDRLYGQYESLPGANWVKTEGYPTTLGFPYRYDFLNGKGIWGLNINKLLNIEAGFGNHKIGNGYRSLLLSDVATYYPYLKFNWQVWKIHFQNIYGQLAASSSNLTRDRLVPSKYFAAHHLSVEILPGLQAGIFESIVFSRANGFELTYLNPFVLYRVAEGALGSPDNILIGGDIRWNLLKSIQLYGQFIFDEFRYYELFVAKRGWWGNKWGLQGGLKYIRFLGIPQLDLQLEYNIVRPYTYAQYRSNDISYTHHAQMLAHPLGANFKELLVRLQWQPHQRIYLDAKYFHINKGLDQNNENYGGNPLADGNKRPQEFNHFIGQGLNTRMNIISLDLRIALGHQIFWDLGYFSRLENQKSNPLLKDSYLRTGIRMNVGTWKTEY